MFSVVARIEWTEISGSSCVAQRVTRVSLKLNPGYSGLMSNFMSHVAVPIAVGAVALVLLLGLINMMRGGSPWTSQKLMRLRVMLQFIAIVVILFAAWVMSK
jgi:hypothetical protein